MSMEEEEWTWPDQDYLDPQQNPDFWIEEQCESHAMEWMDSIVKGDPAHGDVVEGELVTTEADAGEVHVGETVAVVVAYAKILTPFKGLRKQES